MMSKPAKPIPSALSAPPLGVQPPLRPAITAASRRPEPECLPPLLDEARVPDGLGETIAATARGLVQRLRAKGQSGGVEGLVAEYSLSSEEGVALMRSEEHTS